MAEDVPAWAELLAAAFNRQAVEMQALGQWLHQGWEMVAWGAWADNCLVAQYSCLVNQVMAPAGGGRLKVGLSVNMAVHPDFRGRGLIKHVAQPVYAALRESGAVSGVGFSNAAGVKVDRQSGSYGYQVLGQLRPRLLWLTHPPHLQRRLYSPPTGLPNRGNCGLNRAVNTVWRWMRPGCRPDTLTTPSGSTALVCGTMGGRRRHRH